MNVTDPNESSAAMQHAREKSSKVRKRAVMAATTAPAWTRLPSFFAAVRYWAEEWRSRYTLEHILDPRGTVAIRARLRALWESCDEFSVEPQPDMAEVLAGVYSILREQHRRELIRVGEIEEATRAAAQKPFLEGLVGILTAGDTKRQPPKLQAVGKASATQRKPRKGGAK